MRRLISLFLVQETLSPPEPEPIKAGDRVRVNLGMFRGDEGPVVSTGKEGNLRTVTVRLREGEVEFYAAVLEKIIPK